MPKLRPSGKSQGAGQSKLKRWLLVGDVIGALVLGALWRKELK